MGVDLEDAPLFVGDLEGLGATLAPVPAGYWLKVAEDVLLCKDGELEVVAGDVGEGGGGVEDLAEDLAARAL